MDLETCTSGIFTMVTKSDTMECIAENSNGKCFGDGIGGQSQFAANQK